MDVNLLKPSAGLPVGFILREESARLIHEECCQSKYASAAANGLKVDADK